MPYALIPIGISITILYVFTLLLYRSGLILKKTHRQIWNTGLLFTFFITALLGLLLAMQVNFKWEIPWIKELLVWHVNFGLGMSLVAIFHFSWHWGYYRNLLKKGVEKPPVGQEEPYIGSPAARSPLHFKDYLPILTLGFTALISQVIFLREFLSVFHGNELVTGIIFACWMLLTGTGALIGRGIRTGQTKNSIRHTGYLVLGILPLLTVFAIRSLKNIVFPAGSMAGISGIMLFSASLLLCFCLLSGYLFTRLTVGLSERYKTNLLGKSYALESIGSIAGGVLFSFLLVFVLNTYQILFLVLLVNLATAVMIERGDKRTILIAGLIAIAVFLFVFIIKMDLLSRSLLFPGQKILETRDSPYGNIVVTKTGDQVNIYENGSPISISFDINAVEEDVHFAMVQHDQPDTVLVLSGDLAGISVELNKYNIRHADYVELNPWITRVRSNYLEYPDFPWLHILHMDGRKFLRKTSHAYDVVMVNLPAPGTAQLNRYYTTEFFQQIKSHLSSGGILSISLPGAENYLSAEAGSLYSLIHFTLGKTFRNILVVPGQKTFFLASDTLLDIDIPGMIEKKGIETLYVNPYYLDLFSLQERSKQITEILGDADIINHDFHPRAYLLQLNYWLSYFNTNFWIPIIILIILIAIAGFRRNPMETGIFIAGFTGTAAELIILIGIQVVFGYMYLYTAIILTVFMAGLATGASFGQKISGQLRYRHFRLFQAFLVLTIILMVVSFFLMEKKRLPEFLLHTIFVSLTFSVASVSGLLFTTAAILRRTGIASTTSRLYSTDLAGSAAGALITTTLLIPLLGLTGSLVVIVIINLTASLYSVLRRVVI